MNPISVEQVTKRFGLFTAVDHADLQVARGEVVGLVGANGAGKTTLMRMILGLVAPTSGRIRLFGEPQSREQRRRVGYVPQNLGLYTDLTAAENLEFRAEAFGTSAATTTIGAGLVRDLPLGAQRRAAFVAATQHDPELLVLDEPTSGVSPLSRTALWELIRLRAEAGVGVLVSTHYMDEAEQADRVVLMSHGRVVGEGSIAEIVGDRTTTEVRVDDWRRAFDVLDTGERLVTLAGRTIRVLGETPEAVRAALTAAGFQADVGSVPSTLDETMVVLES
jgi:ABC-2 type transport system ATP-binding protein/ribosome-dependent ATPase